MYPHLCPSEGNHLEISCPTLELLDMCPETIVSDSPVLTEWVLSSLYESCNNAAKSSANLENKTVMALGMLVDAGNAEEETNVD